MGLDTVLYPLCVMVEVSVMTSCSQAVELIQKHFQTYSTESMCFLSVVLYYFMDRKTSSRHNKHPIQSEAIKTKVDSSKIV